MDFPFKSINITLLLLSLDNRSLLSWVVTWKRIVGLSFGLNSLADSLPWSIASSYDIISWFESDVLSARKGIIGSVRLSRLNGGFLLGSSYSFLWNLASRIGESSDDDVSLLYHLCLGIIPEESSRFRIGFETNLWRVTGQDISIGDCESREWLKLSGFEYVGLELLDLEKEGLFVRYRSLMDFISRVALTACR